jgi:outer membrane protein OmpA-like peptidoglycan-associated protein
MLNKSKFWGLILILLWACTKKEIGFQMQYKPILTAPDSVWVSWKTENARIVKIAGLNENLPLQGKQRLYFDENTQYEFTAQAGKQTASRKIKIPIRRPAIQSFTCDEFVIKGNKVKIKWSTQNFKSLQISVIDKLTNKLITNKLEPESYLELPLDSSTSFLLEGLSFDNQTLSQTCRAELIYQGKLSGDAKVYPEDSARLSWSYSQHREITLARRELDGTFSILAQSLPETGTWRVAPQNRIVEYRLSAIRSDNKVVEDYFRVYPKVAGILKFAAAQNTIEKNESTILFWNTQELKDLRIEGEKYDLPAKGTLSVSPKLKENKYTLKGYDRFGQEYEESVKINVLNRKYIKNLTRRAELPAGQAIKFDIVETDRSNFPQEIKLKVLAVDTAGNFVADLAPNPETAKKYFLGLIEKAEGKTQIIKNFKVREVNQLVSKPFGIGLVADYSGSMYDFIIPTEIALRTLISEKHPEDQLSMVRFDDKIVQEIPLEINEEKILKKVKFAGLSNFGGSTALYAGADAGLKTLDTTNLQKMLILLTDGYENSSFGYKGKYAHTARLVVEHARQKGIKIHTIALGSGTNVDLLEKLSMLTDGYAYYVGNPQDVNKVYQEIARLFRNYYEISYQPLASEGEHTIDLIYNGLTQKDTLRRLYHVGENYEIDNLEAKGNPGLVINIPPGKKMVAPPQVLANFQFNESFIEKQYESQLKMYADFLKQNPQTVIEIYGHTDLVGEAERQLRLSERRAESIKQHLIQLGIDAQRITTKGFGKTRPIWSQENAPWQARENRRIEVLLLE